MEQFNTIELQNRVPKITSAIAIRCAKVARLLSDLQRPSSDGEEYAKFLCVCLCVCVCMNVFGVFWFILSKIIELLGEFQKEVAADLKRELKKLEKQLLKEKEIIKKMRLDIVMELCIWIGIFLYLRNICLFVFCDFPHQY
jgi:hypothetical protein